MVIYHIRQAQTEAPTQPALTIRAPMARKARSAPEKKNDLALAQRLARIRKDRGFTQVELAEKIGIIQGLVSDYERGKIRPHPDMLARFASALQVSTDEILGLEPIEKNSATPVDRRFLRRLRAIKTLPKRDQDALLRTIDAFLTARQAS